MKSDFTEAYLVACAEVHHLYSIADSFVNSAQLLYKQRDASKHSQSFHLLAAMAFELFPKVIMAGNTCYRNQNETQKTSDDIKDEIMKEQKQVGHNIKKLFEMFPDLITALDIETINKVPDNQTTTWFVNEYRFKIKNEPYLLSIKDVEAVRYGSFAGNQDMALDCTGDEKILNLLLKLRYFTQTERSRVLNQMRKTI